MIPTPTCYPTHCAPGEPCPRHARPETADMDTPTLVNEYRDHHVQSALSPERRRKADRDRLCAVVDELRTRGVLA